jgi:hypothetical protein
MASVQSTASMLASGSPVAASPPMRSHWSTPDPNSLAVRSLDFVVGVLDPPEFCVRRSAVVGAPPELLTLRYKHSFMLGQCAYSNLKYSLRLVTLRSCLRSRAVEHPQGGHGEGD